MDVVTQGMMNAQGAVAESRRNRIMALDAAMKGRHTKGDEGHLPSGLKLSPRQIQQRRKALEKYRPRREQLSQAEHKGMGAVKELALQAHDEDEDDALGDSAEQEELLRLMEEQRVRDAAAAAEAKAAALERQLYFGPPDGEDPRPYQELSKSTAVGYYTHLERRNKQLATFQSQQQTNLMSRPTYARPPNDPVAILDSCQLALEGSAPIVAQGYVRQAGTGAVVGKVGQLYGSREAQSDAEGAVMRKVEGMVGDTVAATVLIGSSVLKHFFSIAEAPAFPSSVLTTLRAPPGFGRMTIKDNGSVSAASGVTSLSAKRAVASGGAMAASGSFIAPPSQQAPRRASIVSASSSSSHPRSTRMGAAVPTVRNSVLNMVRQSMSYHELLAFNELQATPGTIHNNAEHRLLVGYDPYARATGEVSAGVEWDYAANFFSKDLDDFVGEEQKDSATSIIKEPEEPVSLGTLLFPASCTVHQALSIVFLKLLTQRSALGLYRGEGQETTTAPTNASPEGMAAGASITTIPAALRQALLHEYTYTGVTPAITARSNRRSLDSQARVSISLPSDVQGTELPAAAAAIEEPPVSFLSPTSPFAEASNHPLCSLFASLKLLVGNQSTAVETVNQNTAGAGAEVLATSPTRRRLGTADSRPASPSTQLGWAEEGRPMPKGDKVPALARVLPAAVVFGSGGTVQPNAAVQTSSQLEADMAVVVSTVTASTTSAKLEKQRQLALKYKAASDSTHSKKAMLRSGTGGAGPSSSATLAAQMAATATAKAAQQAQQQALANLWSADPHTYRAIEHLLSCTTNTLLSTGFYTVVPSAWRPAVSSFDATSNEANRRGAANRFGARQAQAIKVVARPLIGIHQQQNTQKFNVIAQPLEMDDGDEPRAINSSLGGLVDPYHNPLTVPMPVAISTRPLLRAILRKCLNDANKAEEQRHAINAVAAAKQQAAQFLASKADGYQGGGAGSNKGRAGKAANALTSIAEANNFQTYPLSMQTSIHLQQQQHSPSSPAASISGAGSPSNSTTAAPRVGRILPEAALVTALSPPYVLSVEVPKLWEDLMIIQAAEARHRRRLIHRYQAVALPYYQGYHHHCVLREGLMRASLVELEGKAYAKLVVEAQLSRDAAERATLEREEEELREEHFEEARERIAVHLWPLLGERLRYANFAFADIRRDVLDREDSAFATNFLSNSAPYSIWQLQFLAQLARHQQAYLATAHEVAQSLEWEALERRRRLLSEATTASVAKKRAGMAEDTSLIEVRKRS